VMGFETNFLIDFENIYGMLKHPVSFFLPRLKPLGFQSPVRPL
jgi:hypothetical protein